MCPIKINSNEDLISSYKKQCTKYCMENNITKYHLIFRCFVFTFQMLVFNSDSLTLFATYKIQQKYINFKRTFSNEEIVVLYISPSPEKKYSKIKRVVKQNWFFSDGTHRHKIMLFWDSRVFTTCIFVNISTLLNVFPNTILILQFFKGARKNLNFEIFLENAIC